MTDKTLKGRLDEYRQDPDEDDTGGVATSSETRALPTRKPQRSNNCCCCGVKCCNFWKMFGIVCLLSFGYLVLKLGRWLIEPSPDRLRDMPQFSTSLGCTSAPYENDTVFSVPISSDGGHSIDLSHAGMVGTVRINTRPYATDVGYELSVKTQNKSLLDDVLLDIPTADDIANGRESRFMLSAPDSDTIGSSCVRYDIMILLPPSVTQFTLTTGSHDAHIVVVERAEIDMDKLTILMHGNDGDSMLLPTTGLRAKELHLEMTGGWLVGEVAIVGRTVLSTQHGDAVSKVKVYPVPAGAEEYPTIARLETITGRGRSDFAYIERKGPHRPISSTHRSSQNSDIYLTYTQARFNGRVSVDARASTAFGITGGVGGKGGSWVGNPEGGDMLVVESRSGWVSLCFSLKTWFANAIWHGEF